MKSAQELATEVVGANIDGNKYHEAKINLLARVISAYADERVKEDRSGNYLYQKSYQRGRDEALEEAAKSAKEFDGGKVSPPYDWYAVAYGIAEAILALKSVPEKIHG